jgi:hypothetical protein
MRITLDMLDKAGIIKYEAVEVGLTNALGFAENTTTLSLFYFSYLERLGKIQDGQTHRYSVLVFPNVTS